MADLLAHHSLLYSSVSFKILAPRISAVIDQLCCVAIVFAFGDWMLVDGQNSRPLQQIFFFQILDESLLVCFNCFFNFLYKKMHFYSRLPTRYLFFPMSFDIFFFPVMLAWFSFREPCIHFERRSPALNTRQCDLLVNECF